MQPIAAVADYRETLSPCPKKEANSYSYTTLTNSIAHAVSVAFVTLHYIIVINDFKEKTSIALQEVNAIEKRSFQSMSENR